MSTPPLSTPLSRPVLRVVSEAIGLWLREATSPLPLENIQNVTSSEEIKPLPLANRHERSHRFSLAFDNQPFLAERYPVEQPSQAPPDLTGRHAFGDHRAKHTALLCS